jgi:RNA polymerase sigma-70 factor, ECF subfamily
VPAAVQREAVIERTDGPELDEAFQRHAETVRRAALAVVRDSALADDVTQEVFLALWLNPGRYDPARGSLASLLRVMARSRALDAARHAGAVRRAHDRLQEEAGAAVAPHHDPAEAMTNDLRARRLRRAVRELPTEQRDAIALAYWGDLTAEEVARRHGIPHGTAKSRIRIGLNKLRRDFAD